MPAAKDSVSAAPPTDFLEAFAQVSATVEAGAGLPEVARATARALGASVAILDSSSSVLALACRSPDEERAVLAGEAGTETVDLKVAGSEVGELRLRAREEAPPPDLVRIVGTLIALEVERSTVPERASQAAVGGFLSDLLERRLTDRENIIARGHELGADFSEGGSVLVARATPHAPEEGDWRARVLAVAERGVRAVERTALAATMELGPPSSLSGGDPGRRGSDMAVEVAVALPSADPELAERALETVRRELEMGLGGYAVTVGRSRPAVDAADLHKAGAEALLAANVAQAHGRDSMSFEETGAYRLLLPAMSDNPAELQRFHDETVAPLVAYDAQYDTELVRTLESFLEADGNVAQTAQKLFTHRHTIRYRLERVRELTGLDVGSTDGRERLGLGLKAMRVLGILVHDGPAQEPGAEGGRVPRESIDRG